MENNCWLTIENLAPLIRRKELSPIELTQFLLERISRLQPTINAYITITAETAIAQARQAEKDILKGRYRGALHGIPISIKDLFYSRGIRTTAGSRVLKRFYPKKNAVAVDRLLRAGCILLGKTNLHEFAYGPTNINPHYGPVRNPWDTSRISGGSSGGSAASVISAQAIAALGTDTGGSIRIPAAACGCVGLKPSFGRVPLDGVIPLAPSLDHIGPLSRCVTDAALIFEAIANPLPGDSAGKQVMGKIRQDVKSLRIGVPRQFFFSRVKSQVKQAVSAAIAEFETLGAEVLEVDLKGMERTTGIAAEVTGDEAFAYHAKWLEKRPQDYGKDVRIRLEQSKKATAVAYIQARQEMNAYGQRLAQVLDKVHLLIAPTLPMVAPGIEETEVGTGSSGADIRTALLRLTRPANLSGLPAISIPCGFSSNGLPIGLQLIGRSCDEATLLTAAYAYERATEWHKRFPPDVGTGLRFRIAGCGEKS
jgi:aspartyl-tRNA(Asn)/glutamyl-tRNA(Gln) amidotransferase subunit A